MPKFYRTVVLSFPLAFVLLLLVVPGVYAVSTTTLSKNTTQFEAGYFVEAKNPGSVLSFQSTWNVPVVTCTESGEYFLLRIGVIHEFSPDAGSTLQVTCSGTTSSYSFLYDLGSTAGGLPLGDTTSPGDQMKTIGAVVVSTGALSVTIKDMTKGWTFGPQKGTETPETTQPGGAMWILCGTPAPAGCAGSVSIPLSQFTTMKFGSVKLTMGGHTGTIGSFLSISGISTTEEIWVNPSTNHMVATPTSISSASTGFSIKWLNGL